MRVMTVKCRVLLPLGIYEQNTVFEKIADSFLGLKIFSKNI